MPARTLPTSGRSLVVAPIALAILAAGPFGCGLLDEHQNNKIPQYGYIDPNLPRELKKVSLPQHAVEPTDSLRINVVPTSLGFPNSAYVVRADGSIDLEFFDDLYVAGLTLQEIERKLLLRLLPIAAQKKIEEPVQVSVQLDGTARTRRYYVLGTVNNPRWYPLAGHETVLDGILEAGLRTNSLPEKAYLVRPHPTGGPDQIFRIDWFGITQRGDTLTNYQLLPGDRIYVPGGRPPSLLSTLFGGS